MTSHSFFRELGEYVMKAEKGTLVLRALRY